MNASHSAEQPEFIREQYEFAAHIRDPEANPCPEGVEDRRMAIYRELFYNNIEGFLADGFPVLRQILEDRYWHAMARDFLARHRSQSPLFPEIGQEFLRYLYEERDKVAGDPPFMLELAHYEWVELDVSLSDAERESPPADPNGDLLTSVPVISPLALNLTYRYPVHRISPEYQPDRPGEQPTHLVVYRNRRDDVEFLEINAVTQRLIQLLKDNPEWTGRNTVMRIAKELNHPQPDNIIEAGRQLLQDLRSRDIIIGTRV